MDEQSISSSEFQRFQDQLISLKESKYKTEEKCEFLLRNLSQLETKCLHLERELSKANDLKNRFKSAKDMDILMNENQILRDRLSTIEGNFKLQNDVIRTECENLFSENERLKSQIETYKTSQTSSNIITNNIEDVVDSPVHQDHQYKIRYLQHEVTKLLDEKTKIENENETLMNDIKTLRESENELVIRINSLLNEKTKLTNKHSVIEKEIEFLNSNHSKEIENLISKHNVHIETLKNELDANLENLQSELVENNLQQINQLKNSHEKAIEFIKQEANSMEIELTMKIQELVENDEKLKVSWERKLSEIVINYESKLREKQMALEGFELKYREEVKKWEVENRDLKLNLDYAQEELKLVNKKNQKMLKDVKKQLEKEVKLTLETQSKLDEVVSSGSQNSQTKINEYLSGVSFKMANNDDQSSLYSSQNNGIDNCPMSPSISNSIAVTDDELKNLLDRFTSVQNDLGESRRLIESLNHDKSELIKTIEGQQSIILNYIKNRGKNDPDNEFESPKHNHSTSEVLILNGLMSSQTSNFGLQSIMNKLKDTLKSIAPKDLMSLSDKTVCRVTTAEVKQLQRVCEELMMRCLNLENDLQLAIDLNSQLQTQLDAVL